MSESMRNLVALVPLLLFVGVYAKMAIPVLIARVHELLHSTEQVEWLAEWVFEFSFIGGAIFAAFGIKDDSEETLIGTLVWFMLCMYLHKQLLLRKQALDERTMLIERRQNQNKTAGLIRSIVADEIRKSRLPRSEWSDCQYDLQATQEESNT